MPGHPRPRSTTPAIGALAILTAAQWNIGDRRRYRGDIETSADAPNQQRHGGITDTLKAKSRNQFSRRSEKYLCRTCYQSYLWSLEGLKEQSRVKMLCGGLPMFGPLLPRARATPCPLLAKADAASAAHPPSDGSAAGGAGGRDHRQIRTIHARNQNSAFSHRSSCSADFVSPTSDRATASS